MKADKLTIQAHKVDADLTVLVYDPENGNWLNASGKQIRLGYAVRAGNGERGRFDVYERPPRDLKSRPVVLVGDGETME